jgi:tetratricopeptide (TPR) repeat protein
MPDQIFISYRRDDAAYVTGHINDLLRKEFGAESVFTDVDNIALGVDFRAVLDQSVSQCQVLLAVIGDNWLKVRNKDGNPRLEDPADFVRIEIESALKRNIPVIPLLVGHATMPLEEELPGTLKDLAFRNGTQIRPAPDFNADMDRLIRNLHKYLASIRETHETGAEPVAGATVQQQSVQPEAQVERRKAPRNEMLVGDDERARKQAELGIGGKPAKLRRATRLWMIAILGVAGASWYYADQNPEQVRELLTVVQPAGPEEALEVSEPVPDEAVEARLPEPVDSAGETAVGAPTSFTAAAIDAGDDDPEDAAEAIPDAQPETSALTDVTAESTAAVAEPEPAAEPMADDEVTLTPGTQRQADVSGLISEGVSLAALGDHEAAIQRFDEAIDLEVEPAFLYRQRGASYQALGQYEAAISDYNEVIQLSSEDLNAYYGRGASNFALQNYDAAIADYDAVIRLDPEFIDAYADRADAHEAIGNTAEAARDRATVAVFESNRDN